MPLDDAVVAGFREDVGAAIEEMHEIRSDLRTEGRKRDQRIRLSQTAIALALILAAFSLWTQRDQTIKLNASRLAVCNDTRARALEARAAAKAHDRVFILHLTEGDHTEKTARRVAKYYKDADKQTDKSFPLPDCSHVRIIGAWVSTANGLLLVLLSIVLFVAVARWFRHRHDEREDR